MRNSTTRLWAALAMAVALGAGCGGDGDEPLAHDDETEPFFRRPYPDGQYVLTTFGGPSDSSAYGHKTACGPRVYGKKFYSTGVYGWGCNAKAQVMANGPAAWVESKSAAKCGLGRILDVSPAVSKHLFGASALGWSNCRKVQVKRVSNATPAGPCSSGGGSWTATPLPTDGSCLVGSAKGTCEDTNTSSCATGFKAGYCLGGNNIKCCLDGATSTASGVGTACEVGATSGTCQDTTVSTCATGFKSGYCPGSSNVKCCLEQGAEPVVNGVGGSCQVGSKSGSCLDSNTSSCTSGFETGYCPGGNNVKCCLD